jgi:hypothetical protein
MTPFYPGIWPPKKPKRTKTLLLAFTGLRDEERGRGMRGWRRPGRLNQDSQVLKYSVVNIPRIRRERRNRRKES